MDVQIPKIIHQLWLGDNEMPEHCQQFVQEMKEMHPDYEYHLWGNEVFEEKYKDDEYLQNYTKDPELYKWAFICDRIRLLLLRDHGGIYVDVDAKPVQSFNVVLDKLSPQHTFVSGMKPSQENNTLVDCTVYMAAPNSTMVNECLSTYDNLYWANGCRMFNDKIIETMDTDVQLLGYEYFYDQKIGPKTIILHDIEDTRLLSWTDNPEAKKPHNW